MIIENIAEEIEMIKQNIKNIKEKYLFFKDYKLICAILDKYDLSNFEITYKELENNNSIYIAERREDGIFIHREKM